MLKEKYIPISVNRTIETESLNSSIISYSDSKNKAGGLEFNTIFIYNQI